MLSYNKLKLLELRRVIRWTNLIGSWHYLPLAAQYTSSLSTLKCLQTTIASTVRAHRIRFVEPRILSHEGLAYAKCPVCKKSCHMCDMETHLTVTHKELDVNECAEICRARLQLYEKVMGIPLSKPTPTTSEKKSLELYLPTLTRKGYLCNWCVRRSEVYSTRDAFLKHVACTHAEVDLDEVEPLVGFLTDSHANTAKLEQKEREPPFANQVNQAELTSHSLQQSAVNSSSVNNSNSCNNNVDQIGREAVDEHMTHITCPPPPPPPPPPSSTSSGQLTSTEKNPLSSSSSLSSSPLASGIHTSTSASTFSNAAQAEVKPTRRMQNVKIILEHIPSNDAALISRFTKKNISIPRHMYNDKSGIAINNEGNENGKSHKYVFQERRHGNVAVQREGGVSGMPTPLLSEEMTVEFTPNNFPCELCRRVFTNEHNLLQHLENRHPNGTLEPNTAAKYMKSTSRSQVAHTVQRVKRADDKEPKRELQQCCYTCDMCSSTRTFNSPSSLFAHIRFKHPHADTEFEVARLLESQKRTQRLVCEYCLRAFNGEEALQNHLSAKHPDKLLKSNGGSGDTSGSAKSNSLPEINPKRKWWCSICERGFSSPEAIRVHKTQKHNCPLEQYPCPACKRTFMDVYTLERHLLQSHKSINCRELGLTNHAECKKCGRFFLDFDDLHQHEVKHHNKEPWLPARKLESDKTLSQENAMTTQPVNAGVNTYSVHNSSKITNENNNGAVNDNTTNSCCSTNINSDSSTEQSKKVVKLSELLEKRGPRKVAARRAKARATVEEARTNVSNN